MKKIVGTVLAGAMLAGSAAAADISFSYTGANYFKSNKGNLEYANNDRWDCLALTLSNEICGATVDMDISEGKIVQDEYFGWLTFGLPVGNLQITAGKYNSRYISRVKKDKGDLDGADFEQFKLGVINGSTGKDSDNLTFDYDTDLSGSTSAPKLGDNKGKDADKTLSMFLAYTNDNILPGKLMFKAGLVKSNWRPSAKKAGASATDGPVDDSDNIYNAGFAFGLSYLQPSLVNAEIAFKSIHKSNNSIAVFVSPILSDKLDVTVGYTAATVQKYTGGAWQKWGWEWGFDLRARYQVTDALSFTTMNNLSSGFRDSANADGNTNIWTLWNMVNGTYRIADNLKVGLTVQSVIDGFDANHSCSGANINVSPSLAIQATERTCVTTAVRAEWKDVNMKAANESLGITIPVILSFNY